MPHVVTLAGTGRCSELSRQRNELGGMKGGFFGDPEFTARRSNSPVCCWCLMGRGIDPVHLRDGRTAQDALHLVLAHPARVSTGC